MQVSALISCEAAVFVWRCPKPAGICLWIHGHEWFFQEAFGARADGDKGLVVGDGGSVRLLGGHDLSELLLLVHSNKI